MASQEAWTSRLALVKALVAFCHLQQVPGLFRWLLLMRKCHQMA
jgi:hypothetical protein